MNVIIEYIECYAVSFLLGALVMGLVFSAMQFRSMNDDGGVYHE